MRSSLKINLGLFSTITIFVLLFGIIIYIEHTAYAQSNSSNYTQKVSKYDAKKMAAEKALAKAKEKETERASAAEKKMAKVKSDIEAKKIPLAKEAEKAATKLKKMQEEDASKTGSNSTKEVKTAKQLRAETKAEREKNKDEIAKAKAKAGEDELKTKAAARDAKKVKKESES